MKYRSSDCLPVQRLQIDFRNCYTRKLVYQSHLITTNKGLMLEKASLSSRIDGSYLDLQVVGLPSKPQSSDEGCCKAPSFTAPKGKIKVGISRTTDSIFAAYKSLYLLKRMRTRSFHMRVWSRRG